MIWSQIIVLLALFPALLWVALSRLTPGQSMAFGLAVAGLASGHVSGGTEPLLSFSMHYNRWCWAASLIVAAIALMPPKAGGEVADGAATGLLMAAMAMVKVTFPLSLALPVVFALLRSGRSRTLIVALASALALLAAVTLAEGIGYWTAYAGDLLTVTGSETRAMPSDHWQALILSPVATPATLCMAALIWLLRRGGDSGRAAALMLFYPAFVFISWQNFGNDLIWLCVVALLAWQVDDPEGFFKSKLNTGLETKVDLKKPLPVHLIYRTAMSQAKGQMTYRRDVYGRDAKIWDALAREGVELRGVQG